MDRKKFEALNNSDSESDDEQQSIDLSTLEKVEKLGINLAKEISINKECLIVCDVDKLRIQLSGLNLNELIQKSFFFVCTDKNNNRSVFCILKSSDKVFCLYADFVNLQIPKRIENELKLFNETINIKIYYRDSPTGDVNSLIMQTLEQMMINSKSENDKKKMIANFSDSQKSLLKRFEESLHAFEDRISSFAKDAYRNTFASDVDQLANEKVFIRDLNEFLHKIPLTENAQYNQLLEEIVRKQDADASADEIKKLQKKLDGVKKTLFEKIDQIKASKLQNEDEIKIDIYRKYPEQMKKFDGIFSKLRSDGRRFNVNEKLAELSRKLGLDLNILKMYFSSKSDEKDDANENNGYEKRNIEDIVKKLKPFKESTPSKKDTPLNELLSNIDNVLKETKMVDSSIIGHFRESYVKIKQFGEVWKNRNARDIRNWAIKNYKKLSMTADPSETIAIMNRAFALDTGGYNLRYPQILSILSFLYQQDKGLLAQIQTGEGKTIIIAILATIKVLQGKTVDIVTSNTVLAEEGATKQKNFYDIFNLSVDTNNPDESYVTGGRKCYKADVVYGSIGSFQFDYLRDSFLGHGTRAGRKFDTIFLDEVDNMIVDNASHIAKLSGPFPGMDSLKYIYLKIWMKLQTVEDEIEEIFKTESNKMRQELINANIPDEEAQKRYNNFVAYFGMKTYDRIIELVKNSKPCDVKFIPSHIKNYAIKALDNWIKSALDAKYNYRENVQYIIAKTGERVIQPVDFNNTGVTMKNTIWQHGLHQFLQLKHNLRLTSESLTSCFISNLSYIKKYGKEIYGLTGTLGSDAEKELMSSVYDVKYIRIPTYRVKKFVEYEGEVIDDEIFESTIAEEARTMGEKGRACLIICETIKDAQKIEKVLRKTVSDKKLRKFYFEEQAAEATGTEVEPGTVVIATNIAGRGTDLKPTGDVEKNGGLHVIVAFLPCNKRVEDQAFGRTARQGKSGTAQMLIRQSEVDKLGLLAYHNILDVKEARDFDEKMRIESLKRGTIKELAYQDELFELFSALFNQTKQKLEDKENSHLVMEDLKEFWAFWLSNQDFKNPENLRVKPRDMFDSFKGKVQRNLNGEIAFNPYYCIRQAEYFISNDKLDEAKKTLDQAIGMTQNHEILYSAYMKLFEVSLRGGHVMMNRMKNILLTYLPSKFRQDIEDNFGVLKTDTKYKTNALKYLDKAKKSLKNEIEYLDEIKKTSEFAKIIAFADIGNVKNGNNKKSESANLFLKHFESREKALMLNMEHAASLIDELNSKRNSDFILGSRVSDFFMNLEPTTESEKAIKETVLKNELVELSAVGLNTTYDLKISPGVTTEIMISGAAQIAAGIPFLFFPLTVGVGITMIVEGITDIVVEIIHGTEDFSWKTYLIGKAQSYGVSIIIGLITFGIGAIAKCVSIFRNAAKALRSISRVLKSVEGPLKGVCDKLARQIDKLAGWFRNMEHLAEFRRLSAAERLEKLKQVEKAKDVTQLDVLLSQHMEDISKLTSKTNFLGHNAVVMKSIGMRSTQQVLMVEATTRIMGPAIGAMMAGLKPTLVEKVKKIVNQNINKEKLKYNDFKDIQLALKNVKEDFGYNDILMIVVNGSLEVAKQCRNWKAQLVALAIDQIIIWTSVANYTKSMCEKLNKKFTTKTIKCNDTQVNENVAKLCHQLSEELFELIVSTTIKSSIDGYFIGRATYGNFKHEQVNKARSIDKIKQVEDSGPTGQEEIKAFCDSVSKPVHICDDKGNFQAKLRDDGRFPGAEPLKVIFYPSDNTHPNGHFVPVGQDKTWTRNTGKNNCFFEAAAESLGVDANALRAQTIKKMQSNPQRYVALNVHDQNKLDVLMKGGFPGYLGRDRHEIETIINDNMAGKHGHHALNHTEDEVRTNPKVLYSVVKGKVTNKPKASHSVFIADEKGENGTRRTGAEVMFSLSSELSNDVNLQTFVHGQTSPNNSAVARMEIISPMNQFSEKFGNNNLNCKVYKPDPKKTKKIEETDPETKKIEAVVTTIDNNIMSRQNLDDFVAFKTIFPVEDHTTKKMEAIDRGRIVIYYNKELLNNVLPPIAATIQSSNGVTFKIEQNWEQQKSVHGEAPPAKFPLESERRHGR